MTTTRRGDHHTLTFFLKKNIQAKNNDVYKRKGKQNITKIKRTACRYQSCSVMDHTNVFALKGDADNNMYATMITLQTTFTLKTGTLNLSQKL